MALGSLEAWKSLDFEFEISKPFEKPLETKLTIYFITLINQRISGFKIKNHQYWYWKWWVINEVPKSDFFSFIDFPIDILIELFPGDLCFAEAGDVVDDFLDVMIFEVEL